MTVLTPPEIAELPRLIGRYTERRQVLDAASLSRFSAALGHAEKDPAPALAHWAFFHEVVSDAKIGTDGHPLRGEFLPALPALPRRMFAASRIDFIRPLNFGAAAEIAVTITDVRCKEGRSSPLVFVDVMQQINQEGECRTRELQTLVFMPVSGQSAPLPLPVVGSDEYPAEGELWTPSSVNLFRFSAATFNMHRIHYDYRYAVGVEGHPALVVHGPFIAAKLADLARRRGTLKSFEFRATAPCFVDQPIHLVENALGELSAIRCDNIVSMRARVTYQ